MTRDLASRTAVPQGQDPMAGVRADIDGIDRALVARQQSTIDVLADFGEIPGGRVSADGSVDFRFDTHPAT